jgi:peroxiredoxin
MLQSWQRVSDSIQRDRRPSRKIFPSNRTTRIRRRRARSDHARMRTVRVVYAIREVRQHQRIGEAEVARSGSAFLPRWILRPGEKRCRQRQKNQTVPSHDDLPRRSHHRIVAFRSYSRTLGLWVVAERIPCSKPEFRLPLFTGGVAALSGLLAGGQVVLAFFKVTCPVCQMTFPYLQRLHDAGFRVYGISQNDAGDAREFNEEFGITFPTLIDSEDSGFPVSNDYGISSVPTLFLVQPNGNIARVAEGWVKRDMEWLGTQAGVEIIRPGERVPETRPG